MCKGSSICYVIVASKPRELRLKGYRRRQIERSTLQVFLIRLNILGDYIVFRRAKEDESSYYVKRQGKKLRHRSEVEV
jgi:hypothetical protein